MIDVPAVARALERLEPRIEAEVPRIHKAAVAAVLRDTPRGVELLFMRRAEHPRDPWSGQMGFPGGRVDPEDETPLAAAIRETREEVGLDLAVSGRMLGPLSEVRTHLPLGMKPHSVAPFAFAVSGDPVFDLNHEVQETVWVPLAFLADADNRRSFTWVRKGVPLPMPSYHWGNRVIWGLTLRIVDEMVDLLRVEYRPRS